MEVVQSFPEACLPAQNRVERLFTEGPYIEVPKADTMTLAKSSDTSLQNVCDFLGGLTVGDEGKNCKVN
jgi:hypothetical protein